jgi:hypothetical protein
VTQAWIQIGGSLNSTGHKVWEGSDQENCIPDGFVYTGRIAGAGCSADSCVAIRRAIGDPAEALQGVPGACTTAQQQAAPCTGPTCSGSPIGGQVPSVGTGPGQMPGGPGSGGPGGPGGAPVTPGGGGGPGAGVPTSPGGPGGGLTEGQVAGAVKTGVKGAIEEETANPTWPADPTFNGDVTSPELKDLSGLLNTTIANPFTSLFTGTSVTASGECSASFAAYGHAVTLSICEWAGVLSVMGTIVLGGCYIRALFIAFAQGG